MAKYANFLAFRDKFVVTPAMLDELMVLGEKSGVKKDEESVKIMHDLICRQIRALIARDLYDPGNYFSIMMEDDKEVAKALELFSDPKAYARYLNR